MEWWSCSSTVFLFSSFLFVTTNGDFPTGALQAIRCMLLQTAPEDCSSVPKVVVPPYLTSAYVDIPSPVQEALRSRQLTELSNAQVGRLPTSLLYLIPKRRLAELNGTQLGAMLQNHEEDTSLARQLVASLRHPELVMFAHKLKMATLSQEVLDILGSYIEISDLNAAFFRSLPSEIKTLLLARLRPAVILRLDVNTFSKVVSQLVELELSELPRKETLQVISQAASRHRYSLSRFGWLAAGLSPDELLDDSIEIKLNKESFKLDLTRLKARAVFDRMYLNKTPEILDTLPKLFYLSPSELQRLSPRAFDYTTLSAPSPGLSLPTACQIREYVKAECVLTGKLPKELEEWGSRVRYLHWWVYTLPLINLYEYLDTALSTPSLQMVDSQALSPMQAYYLTGCGAALNVMDINTILGLGKMLEALPASQLIQHKVGDINSDVMQHLVAHLSADNRPRSLALVHKIASSIDELFILEHLLKNKDVGNILNLVTPKDLQAAAPRMMKLLEENKMFTAAHKFPQPVLATLLEQARRESGWSWQNLLIQDKISYHLLGGLTCQHLDEMDDGLFIPIMAVYNRQRTKGFPKNLQHCCLRKLISHLKLKLRLTQTDPENGLIYMLEPIEIEAVGGFVLVGLPIDALKVSPYLTLILETIGHLPMTELILAADMPRLQEIASLAIKEEGQVDVFTTGNLVWFLPPSASIPELKLGLEAGWLDTTLCLPVEARRSIALNLITLFGPPEDWSAGVLATLQDLLIVFTDSELQNVSRSAWTKAADSFSSHYTEVIDWITPMPFYQICVGILGKPEEAKYKLALGRLARRHLMAAQWMLETVRNVTNTGEIDYKVVFKNTKIDQEEKIAPFNPKSWMASTSTKMLTGDNEDIDIDTSIVDISDEEPIEDKMPSTSTTEENVYSSSTTNKHNTMSSSTEDILFSKSSTTEENVISKITTEKIIHSSETNTENSILSNETKPVNAIPASQQSIEETVQITTNEDSTFYSDAMTELNVFSNKNPNEENKLFTNAKQNSMREGKISSADEKNMPDEIHTSSDLNNSHLAPSTLSLKDIITTTIRTVHDFQAQTITEPPVEEHNNSINDIDLVITEQSIPVIDTNKENSNEEINSTLDNEMSSKTINNINPKVYQGSTIVPNTEGGTTGSLTSQESGELDAGQNNNRYLPAKETEEPTSILPTQESDKIEVGQEETGVLPAQQSEEVEIKKEMDTLLPSKKVQIQVPYTSGKKPLSHPTNLVPSTYYTESFGVAIGNHTLKENNESKNSLNEHNFTQKIDIKINEMSKASTSKKPPISQMTRHTNTSLQSSSSPADTSTYDDEEYEASESIIEDTTMYFDRDGERDKRSTALHDLTPSLTCNALRMVGRLAALALTKEDLKDMLDEELEECRVELGSMDLSFQLKTQIWKRIKNKEVGIHLLGGLLQVATVGDLWDVNVEISQPWGLENIDAFIRRVNNTLVLEKLLASVQNTNSDYTSELLAVLGPTICSLEPENLRALSIMELEPWTLCPSCLTQLARIAIEQLGPPSQWTSHHVHALHSIVTGLTLEDWMILAASIYKPLAALHPTAIKCLNTSHLQALSPDQLQQIPALALLALSDQQIATLNVTQLWAIGNITQLTILEKVTSSKDIHLAGLYPSSGSYHVLTLYLFIYVGLLHILIFT